jgi:general secretion pathway protein H
MVGREDSWSLGRGAGESSPKGPVGAPERAAGFTLLEILLAVALVGLLAVSLTTTSWHLIGDRPLTPEDIFWQATREARKAALKAEHEERLSYDGKEKTFVVTDGAATQKFPLPPVRDLEVDLLPGQQGKSSVLIGGQLVDTRSLPSVSFYADGTCQPFRVQFRAGGPARILSIDPWTCAPVIASPDATP